MNRPYTKGKFHEKQRSARDHVRDNQRTTEPTRYQPRGDVSRHNQHPVILAATAYAARFGWGIHGKMLGISRMLQDSDIALLKTAKCVIAARPRGILSGFLAIIPGGTGVVYLPPSTGKEQPRLIRLRVSEDLRQEGALLSCYSDGVDLIVEDVLVWKGKPVFQTLSFADRWAIIGTFLEEYQVDTLLQGFALRLSEYAPLDALGGAMELEERQVIEIVPNAPNMKRLVWVPPTEDSSNIQTWIARRESLIGPDIFSLWSVEGVRQPNIALIRTLAVSCLLRQYAANEFMVNTTWNKLFNRWEIVGIPGSPAAAATITEEKIVA